LQFRKELGQEGFEPLTHLPMRVSHYTTDQVPNP
jgi:hypothetical protein